MADRMCVFIAQQTRQSGLLPIAAQQLHAASHLRHHRIRPLLLRCLLRNTASALRVLSSSTQAALSNDNSPHSVLQHQVTVGCNSVSDPTLLRAAHCCRRCMSVWR